MRTLLIGTGLCLTAGTFFAAERFSSSAELATALEFQAAAQATVEEKIKQSSAKFVAEIASLESEKEKAEAEVASMTTALEDLTASRNDLASQIITAQKATKSIGEALTNLEATNLELVGEIEEKDASLVAKAAELAALNAQIETLAQNEGGATEPTPEQAELVAEIASLNEILETRDETIAELQDRLDTTEVEVAVASANLGEDANPALLEELKGAMATIDELTLAASEQATESEAALSALNEVLRERDATVAQLQAELEERGDAEGVAEQAAETTGETSDELEALSVRLSELTELVDSQTKTISNLRMGFEYEPESAMEMASACIDRANKIFEISQIKFATGTSSISEQSTATLDHLRDLAIGCESDEMFIEIGGHTDSLGAEADNQKLSEARARSVRDFLIGRGIPEDTMVAVGFGESQPIATNDTPVGRAQNRRITFTWQMREKTPEIETTENIDG